MNSVVIGSGFGGIAAALRLKAKGHNVTLIEKHPDLGGRARVFKKNVQYAPTTSRRQSFHYNFDLWTHFILRKKMGYSLFNGGNRKYNQRI